MRCTISQIYFGIELYMFRAGLLSIIRSLVLYTQQKVFVIQVMLSASAIRMELIALADSLTCMTNIYCCVYSIRLLIMNSKPLRIM